MNDEFVAARNRKNKEINLLIKNPMKSIGTTKNAYGDYYYVYHTSYLPGNNRKVVVLGTSGSILDAIAIRDEYYSCFFGISKYEMNYEKLEALEYKKQVNIKSVGYPVYKNGNSYFSIIRKDKKSYTTSPVKTIEEASDDGFDFYILLTGQKHKKDNRDKKGEL